ncbi:zincin-like metallopeptidase domain-containing protein [Tianweitania populi]|uniref:Polyvalent protein metallopeptidase domain-containing protein n=1 Tax=Tianweitania populi TaxID=1607949 RepID=A0A8J3GLZ8_9HYPH|nr:hypothetical protein GCM10016234_35180 [Tianweitania populi]
MPPFETVRDAASYVAVLSHEHIHWTAKADRVSRDLSPYTKYKTRWPDRTADLESWLTVRANYKRAIFQAAADA